MNATIDNFITPREGKRLYITTVENTGSKSGCWHCSPWETLAEHVAEFTSHLESNYSDDETYTERTVPNEAEPELEGADNLTWNEVYGGRHQGQLILEWCDDPWHDKQIVACQGSHYGFDWGGSAEDLGTTYELPERLKTRALEYMLSEYLSNNDETATRMGIEILDDPTDDGNNYAVSGHNRFRTVADALASAAADGELDENQIDATLGSL